MMRVPTGPPSGAGPTNAAIAALFAKADRARVIEGGADAGRPLGTAVMWEAPRADLTAMCTALRVHESGAEFHCMCLGDLAIELIAGQTRIDTIGFHHAASVRVHGFRSDAALVDGVALLRLLAARGVRGPLAGWERDQEASRQMGVARAAWVAAAPRALLPSLSQLENDAMGMPLAPRSSKYDEALVMLRAAGDDDAIAGALLEWFGKGVGPWSGYPSYEGLPEAVLRRLDAEVVARATRHVSAAGAVGASAVVGAARFASAHETVSARRRFLALLDEVTLDRLVAAADGTRIADNVARMKYARAIAVEQRAYFASGAPFVVAGAIHVVGLGQNGVLQGLATDGVSLVSVDVDEIVRFDPGSIRPTVLGSIGDGHGEIRVADGRVTVTRFDQKGAMSVPLDGSEGVRAQAPSAERPSGAYAWASDDAHVYWMSAVPWGKEPVLARTSRADGVVEEIAQVPPLESTLATPPFVIDDADVLWSEREVVLARAKSGGATRRLFTAGGVVIAMRRDAGEVWAIVCAEKQATPWHLERARAGEASSTRIATFERLPYHRHALVVTRAAVCFTSGDRVFGVSRT